MTDAAERAYDAIAGGLSRFGRKVSVAAHNLATSVKTKVREEAQEHWEKDEEVAECRECKKKFSVLRRKHHCRKCGQVFCDSCSSGRMPIAPYYVDPARVCTGCLATMRSSAKEKPLCELELGKLGVSAFLYLSGGKGIVVACQDYSFASKVESKLGNLTLPWEKKPERVDEIGAVYLFRREGDVLELEGDEEEITLAPTAEVSYKMVHASKYSHAATALTYDSCRDEVIVGFEDGTIRYFAIGDDFSSLKKTEEVKGHDARVGVVQYLDSKDVVLSCSSDKIIQLFDRQNNSFSYNMDTKQYDFRSCTVDYETQRLILGSTNGTICMFDFSEGQLRLCNKMDNHSKEIRWLSYHSSSKQLLAAGGDCLISVWDMTRMGTNKGAFVGHTRRVRCVEKLARTSIVSAGDGGMVFVWDTQSAEPVYIFCGHEAPITCLHVADEGRTLITAGKDKRIKLWHLDFST